MSTDGLHYAQVRIADLSDGEFTERLERELTEVALIVSDTATYGDRARGRVTVTLDVIASPDRRASGSVIIQAGWSVKTPKALPEALTAWVRGGRLVTQHTEQIDLAQLQQRMTEERAMLQPEAPRAPAGSPRRRETVVTQRAERAPAVDQGPQINFTEEDETND